MLIVVIVGKWSDDSACFHDVRLYSMLNTEVISGDAVCCGVVFGTLVGVYVFSVMWSELLMTSAISWPLWSSVYADVLWMRVVHGMRELGGVCEMCWYLARGGMGGEGVSG